MLAALLLQDKLFGSFAEAEYITGKKTSTSATILYLATSVGNSIQDTDF